MSLLANIGVDLTARDGAQVLAISLEWWLTSRFGRARFSGKPYIIYRFMSEWVYLEHLRNETRWWCLPNKSRMNRYFAQTWGSFFEDLGVNLHPTGNTWLKKPTNYCLRFFYRAMCLDLNYYIHFSSSLDVISWYQLLVGPSVCWVP